MAVVGEAHIVVRALTAGVESDIRKGFSNLDGVASRAGGDMGNALTRGLRKSFNTNNVFGNLSRQLKELYPEAEAAATSFTRLMRIGYSVQGAFGAIAGSIGTVVAGLVSLVGAAGGAAVSVVSLGSALASAFTGAKIAGMALKGVGRAAGALAKGGGGGGGGADPIAQQKQINDALKNLAQVIENNEKAITSANNRIRAAQLNLNEALKEGREEIQQLGFEAESAALSESRASIELGKAREALARVQDLPPNSRARKEAELAYQEAELNYRMAKDRSTDLNKEQERLARTGVEGTEVVRSAREDLAEAEENLNQTVIDAARDQADAQERLAEALRGVQSAAGGAASALEGLTASQRVFAQYLATEILPKIEELREAVASKFLPALQTALDKLFNTGFFDGLKQGFELVAVGAGEAVNKFADAIVEPENARLLFQFLEQTANLLPTFGSIFGNVWGIVLRLIDASSEMTENFVNFLETKTGAFVDFLDAKKASGELTEFFNNVQDVTSKLGTLFGNVFAGLGNIIVANIGPGTGGAMLLDWLGSVTEGFASADPTYLENYFKGAAENVIAIAETFSVLVSSISRAGVDPAVGEFWRILGSGATAFDTIVQEAVKVGPSLAMLIKQITEIVAVFADAAQATAFLDTLAFLTGGLAAAVKAMKPFIDAVGPAIGVISAVTLAWALLGKGMMVGVGFITKGATALGLITPAATAATAATVANTAATSAAAVSQATFAVAANGTVTSLAKVAPAAKVAGAGIMTAMGPVGWIILGISAAITGIVAVLAIQQERTDKATAAIDEGFRKGATSVQVFDAALLSLADGGTKEKLGALASQQGGLNGALEAAAASANTAGRSYGRYSGAASQTAQLNAGLKTSFDAVGQSLGDLAVSELPDAQSQFKGFTDAQNLSNEAQLQALAYMPEYSKQLQDQAALYGIDLYDAQTGAIDNEKLLAFARGEGEIAIINQTEALRNQSIEIGESIASSVESMQFQDGQLVDSEKTYTTYLEEMKQKTVYNAAEIAAQNELLAQGVSATAIQEAIDAGVSVQNMRDSVLAGGQPMIDEVNRTTSAAMQTYNAAVAQFGVNGISSVEQAAMDAYNANVISLDEFLAVTKQTIEGYTPTQVIKPDTSEWKDVQARINAAVPKTISVAVAASVSLANRDAWFASLGRGNKNGGFIKGFANGGMIKRYAGGGSVFGLGGPRDDRVPAMLSAGEYVINAMATKRYKPLLSAINNGSPISPNSNATMGTSAPNINITVNPSQGMDERELASVISRELAFQMRMGGV